MARWRLIPLVVLVMSLWSPALHAADRERIRPWRENPRYWEYKGKPLVLLGGSKEDNLYQVDDLEAHLDLLRSVGGNYIRNTMSCRDEGNVWWFAQRPDGKYDLEAASEEHWRRFKTLLDLALERDIIVQIELWDRFDFAGDVWLRNPYRPANNVNYDGQESRLRDAYPNHPNRNENRFFFSVPQLDDNRMLLKYQRAQVDRMLEIALPYPNVLYCMDNETNGRPEWGAYWARHIREKARKAGLEVHVTEMWDEWNIRKPMHRHTLDHPELYTFIDISQNNHNRDQAHWDNLQWARQHIAGSPRPINHVKIYGADSGRFGNDRDGVERFWRGLIGGAASVRFHRPTSGLGLSEKAQAHLRSARMLLERFDILHAEPDSESKRLSDREDNEAYVCCIPGRQYAVYFPDGGAVTLHVHGEATTEWSLAWLDAVHSRWQSDRKVRGSQIALSAPGSGPWIALISR